MCVIPHDEDPDIFDGRAWLAGARPARGVVHRRGSLICVPASAEAEDGAEVEDPRAALAQEIGGDEQLRESFRQASSAGQKEAEEAKKDAEQSRAGRPLGVDSYERRDIIAKGMKRFEGISKIPPKQPDIERLSPRVINILAQNPAPYTLNGTNCYLVGTGPRRFLIDTGEEDKGHEECMELLAACMEREGVTGLDAILITHMHGDHFGGVDGLQRRWGPVPVAMLPVPDHQLSLYTINEIERRGLTPYFEKGPRPNFGGGKGADPLQGAPIPGWPGDDDLSWDFAGRSKAELQQDFWYMRRHADFYQRWFSDAMGSIPSIKLSHGDILRTEGATLTVMHTPGHAENHAAFVLHEEQAIFSGDHVLGYGTTFFSDLYEYMASLEAMKLYRPLRLYPGHGPYIQDGYDLLDRYVEHRQAREDQVVDHIKTLADIHADEKDRRRFEAPVRTAQGIAEALYVNTSPARLQQAKENVEKVLLKLWREGRARCYNRIDDKLKPADLPSFGYVRRLDPSLLWQLKHASDDDDGDGVADMEQGRGSTQAFIEEIAAVLPPMLGEPGDSAEPADVAVPAAEQGPVSRL